MLPNKNIALRELRIMDKIIKVGIGVVIVKDNKILLGHRVSISLNTGGIYEPDSFTCPSGKQE